MEIDVKNFGKLQILEGLFLPQAALIWTKHWEFFPHLLL